MLNLSEFQDSLKDLFADVFRMMKTKTELSQAKVLSASVPYSSSLSNQFAWTCSKLATILTELGITNNYL